MDERTILLSLRAALLAALLTLGRDARFRPSFVMAVSAIEDALGLPRSCPSRAARRSDAASSIALLQSD